LNQYKFGKLVTEKRKALGISQLKLGRQIQPKNSRVTDAVIQKAISNIETGANLADRNLVASVCRRLKIIPIPEIENVSWKLERPQNLFEPVLAEEDLVLISNNAELLAHLNRKFTEITKVECQKFRKVVADMFGDNGSE